MLQARRVEAEAAGISADLIEDVLRRIIRESYQAEGDHGYQCAAPDLGPVVIVGGKGQMGRLFTKLFRLSEYQVASLDLDNPDETDQLLATAALIVISVPINQTPEVIQQLAGKMNPEALLVDITSRKREPVEAMLAVHNGPVMGLHPMFGPDVTSLAKQVVVHTPGRDGNKFNWLLLQFQLWGARLLPSDPAEHDHMMAVIQALRHFTTFAYGTYLHSENINLKQATEFSSPIYRLELAMVGRLFAQDSQLYADIIFSSTEGKQLIRKYIEHLQQAVKLLDDNNVEGFIQQFANTSEWFGPLRERLLQESSTMLERQQEHL
jgi:chorismate mutase/prephenate dehydrogenase